MPFYVLVKLMSDQTRFTFLVGRFFIYYSWQDYNKYFRTTRVLIINILNQQYHTLAVFVDYLWQ